MWRAHVCVNEKKVNSSQLSNTKVSIYAILLFLLFGKCVGYVWLFVLCVCDMNSIPMKEKHIFYSVYTVDTVYLWFHWIGLKIKLKIWLSRSLCYIYLNNWNLEHSNTECDHFFHIFNFDDFLKQIPPQMNNMIVFAIFCFFFFFFEMLNLNQST